MPLAKDLLHPLHHEEKRKHKLKRLVQHPNSYFMDVKCAACRNIAVVFRVVLSILACLTHREVLLLSLLVLCTIHLKEGKLE